MQGGFGLIDRKCLGCIPEWAFEHMLDLMFSQPQMGNTV